MVCPSPYVCVSVQRTWAYWYVCVYVICMCICDMYVYMWYVCVSVKRTWACIRISSTYSICVHHMCKSDIHTRYTRCIRIFYIQVEYTIYTYTICTYITNISCGRHHIYVYNMYVYNVYLVCVCLVYVKWAHVCVCNIYVSFDIWSTSLLTCSTRLFWRVVHVSFDMWHIRLFWHVTRVAWHASFQNSAPMGWLRWVGSVNS